MKSRSIILGGFFLTLCALALSYFKFSRCIPGGWLSPDVYVQGCYTDITALYEMRRFASDVWPYGSGGNSLEYPILSGIGIWLISLLTKDGPEGLLQFFYLNVLAISIAFAALVYHLFKLEKKSALLLIISPAVISGLFINWDIWAITPLVIALLLIKKERIWFAGACLSISIFFKFFPIIYLIPILLSLKDSAVKRKEFIYSVAIISCIINIPFMLFQFDGWAKFYIFNFNRGVDFGSIWYLISLTGSWITNINSLITPIVLTLLALCYWRYRDNLLGNLFIASVIFFTLNKVYSPQYVLWLTVIAVLFFPKNRFFYILFALWQSSELLYQYGIWHHILTSLDEPGGIANNTYILISIARIAGLLLLTGYALYLLENDLIKSRRSETNV